MVTTEPFGAVLPPAGDWAITRRPLPGLVNATGTALTRKPAARRMAVAVACRWPTTFGTRLGAGRGLGGGTVWVGVGVAGGRVGAAAVRTAPMVVRAIVGTTGVPTGAAMLTVGQLDVWSVASGVDGGL